MSQYPRDDKLHKRGKTALPLQCLWLTDPEQLSQQTPEIVRGGGEQMVVRQRRLLNDAEAAAF
jgi:hypothetical protein